MEKFTLINKARSRLK